LAARDMTSLTLGSLRRERSSTLRALRPCCINDLWLRLDCRICRPRKRSETTTATLLASDARSARLMDDMTILALAPRTAIRNRTARSFRSASNMWISRQSCRLSRVLATKSDFLSNLRRRRTRPQRSKACVEVHADPCPLLPALPGLGQHTNSQKFL